MRRTGRGRVQARVCTLAVVAQRPPSFVDTACSWSARTAASPKARYEFTASSMVVRVAAVCVYVAVPVAVVIGHVCVAGRERARE